CSTVIHLVLISRQHISIHLIINMAFVCLVFIRIMVFFMVNGCIDDVFYLVVVGAYYHLIHVTMRPVQKNSILKWPSDSLCCIAGIRYMQLRCAVAGLY